MDKRVKVSSDKYRQFIIATYDYIYSKVVGDYELSLIVERN
ncbi:hypothetical protein [Mechercharimyces sp. CAU 1602]|nr:hypothetical protein [Mechercharimyces sp. CAU 1602]MCS1350884.1 hypothetical protein [Mechercharimyces sp. CAU 1602]